MLRKRRLTIFIVVTLSGCAAFGVQYANNRTYLAEPFFTLPLTTPATPIRELLNMHYALSSYVIRTPAAVDAAGCFYIMGLGRDKKVQILVTNPKGKIVEIITPRLMDGQPIEHCYHFSVSPSGTRIWTVTLQDDTTHVTLHKRTGLAESKWTLKRNAISYWRIYADSEGGAYVVVGNGGLTCFHFVIGRKRPHRFRMPIILWPVFFHNGMFWQNVNFDDIKQQLSKSEIKQSRTKGSLKKGWAVVTWTPKEGLRVVRRCLSRFPIYWIDPRGNFYCITNTPLRDPIYHFFTLLLKIRPLRKMGQYLGISKPPEIWVQAIKVFSPYGELLETIALPSVIRPRKGEKLEYGQLVKVDETGIYLEVERVSEPREYRIVRIVKKPRWQVWLESLTKRTER